MDSPRSTFDSLLNPTSDMRFEGETLQAHSQFQQVVLPPASIESTQTPNGSGHGRVELQAASQQKAALEEERRGTTCGWCPTRPPTPALCCPAHGPVSILVPAAWLAVCRTCHFAY